MPQSDVVHDALTVQEALEYAGELRFAPDVAPDERSARIDEVIAELGLEPCRNLRSGASRAASAGAWRSGWS